MFRERQEMKQGKRCLTSAAWATQKAHINLYIHCDCNRFSTKQRQTSGEVHEKRQRLIFDRFGSSENFLKNIFRENESFPSFWSFFASWRCYWTTPMKKADYLDFGSLFNDFNANWAEQKQISIELESHCVVEHEIAISNIPVVGSLTQKRKESCRLFTKENTWNNSY